MDNEPWQVLMDAESRYLVALWDVKQAGIETELNAALKHQRGPHLVLRVLLFEPPEQTMPFVSDLFPYATNMHSQVLLAREVIGRVNSGWLFVVLRPLIAKRLDAPEADYADYRWIAEALEQWDQYKHLADLVARAATSDDPDIVEVADDFRRTYSLPDDLGRGASST